jgi:putative ABC transport system ATP-binding protein
MLMTEFDDILVVLQGVLKKRKEGTGYSLLADDLFIGPTERVALLGDSGSGKSTLLDLIAMVLKPEDAKVFTFFSRQNNQRYDLWKIWGQKKLSLFEGLRRSELGYIMQTGGLLPFLDIKDNIILPANIKVGYSAKTRNQHFDYLISELRIGHLLKKYPSEVSVGERQRCAIARALIHKPSLVLADEPTASLDPPTANRVFDLLLTLCQDSALVVSTHDHRRIKERSDFTVWNISCVMDPQSGSIEATVSKS